MHVFIPDWIEAVNRNSKPRPSELHRLATTVAVLKIDNAQLILPYLYPGLSDGYKITEARVTHSLRGVVFLAGQGGREPLSEINIRA